jgi:hypothetical protein
MSQRCQTAQMGGGKLRIRDALLAADSIHHIVSACAVFGGTKNWPSWGDAVLLEWMSQREIRSVLAELDDMTEEYQFVSDHIAGITSCQEWISRSS